MCKGRVCFNLLITPVYFEILVAIDSVCELHFICLLSMIPRNLKSLTISISSSIKVFFGYITCFCGIWNTVILVFDVFISNLFCVSQVTIREILVLMLCVIVVMSVLPVCIMKSIICTV